MRPWAERPSGSVVFIENGEPVTASAVSSLASRLNDGVRAAKASRAAVFTRRPSLLGAALLAGAEGGWDLLLLRERRSRDDPFLTRAAVEAVIEEDSSVRETAAPRLGPASPGGAILIPTSGTSGSPKIARHALSGLLGRIRPVHAGAEPARWLLTYQPNGFAGLQMILTVLATDSLLVSSGEMSAPGLAEAALAHRVTHISGTPTLWRSFLICLGDSARQLPLKQATLGGETADQAILDRIRRTFPRAAVSHIYASTEAGSLFSVRDGRAGFPAAWLAEPADGARLRIRDGMLEVLSPRMMLGYLQERETPLTEDGWLKTFDRVVRRGGRVYFLGREDSVINVGGAKVTPEEVETALLDVPGVFDLRAFAVPNPISGFLVGLEIVAADGADTGQVKKDIAAAAARKLEPHKIPRLIRFVGAIPCDPSGKKSRKP